MPSIAAFTPPLPPLSPLAGRKRRRDDGGGTVEVQMKLSPFSKSASLPTSTIGEHGGSRLYTETRRTGHLRPLHPHNHQRSRLLLSDGKRQRVDPQSLSLSHPPESTHLRNNETRESSSSSSTTTAINSNNNTKPHMDLSPCHVCHRKPTLKSELDSYAYCEACGLRTCYICIRECLGSLPLTRTSSSYTHQQYLNDGTLDIDVDVEGDHDLLRERAEFEVLRPLRDTDGEGEEDRNWMLLAAPHTHRGMVCSGCCVERGVDGEVWCLGCVEAEEGGRG